jgi:short-subunit dehydrogenase
MTSAGTTLIIGASPDLVEMASVLGREGERIALISRNETRLLQYRERLKGRRIDAQYFVCDVTDSTTVQQAFEALAKWTTHMQRMIYNVGIVSHENAATVTSLGIHKVMSPNFFGFVNCFQFALHMFRRSGRGHAVALSSAHALEDDQAVAYAASKAALRIYAAALRKELSGEKVRISEVYLGQVRESGGWRDLVCEEIVSGMLEVLAAQPDRFVIGESFDDASPSKGV